MPWTETCAVTERMQFVAEFLKGEHTMSELCRLFSVSRKTGYKWVARYQAEGPQGLNERSRAPLNHANAVTPAVVELLVGARRSHPSWGPRKLITWLGERHPELSLPAASTVGELLKRYGLSQKRRPSFGKSVGTGHLTEASEPNRVWSADHKGEFKTQDGHYCYPLTLSDRASRYLLACVARLSTRGREAWPVFEAAFQEYGLPEIIRSDNGPPFSSKAPGGLSRLSIGWLKLGIRHERIVPGHPEQNGRHERMHRTLKAEATHPPGRDLRHQQQKLDVFTQEYNQERPHEALAMKTPASQYRPSERVYPTQLPAFGYPAEYRTRLVHETGRIRWPGRYVILLGAPLEGEIVGCKQVNEDIWHIYLGPLRLGFIDVTQIDLGLMRMD